MDPTVTPMNSAEENTEVLTPPPTPKKKDPRLTQSCIKRRASVMGFSLEQPMKNQRKKKRMSPVVSLVSSEDEEINELNEIFETPIILLGERMLKASNQNLTEFETFFNFSEALFQHTDPDYIGSLPILSLVILLAHLPQHTTPIIVDVFLDKMLNPSQWKPQKQLQKKQLQVASILCQENTDSGLNVWLEWMKLQKLIHPTKTSIIEDWQVKSLLRIWEVHADTSRIFVSRRVARKLFNSLMNYESYPDHLLQDNSVLCPVTTPTYTLSTPARTQTVLVAVPGSREVQSGEQEDSLNIDDEFTLLTSQLQNGKTSLDISLQMATQSKTLKAEVQMAEYVYDLKIYR